MAKSDVAKLRKETVEMVDDMASAINELAQDPDTPEEVAEELKWHTKTFQAIRKKCKSATHWTVAFVKSLGRRLRNFAHACKDFLLAAFDSIVGAISKAIAWLVQKVEDLLSGLLNVADRLVRVAVPTAEDKAKNQLEELNDMVVDEARHAVA